MKHKKALTAIAKLIDEVTTICAEHSSCEDCPFDGTPACNGDPFSDKSLEYLYNLIKERIEE